MDLLHYLASGVCAQRPAHTFAIGGRLLPLEARMGGLFVGYLICLAYLTLLGRASATQLPRGWVAVALLAGVAATGLDGLNAYAFDLGALHLYAPTLPLRLATGLVAGFGVAAFSLPALAGLVLAEGDPAPPFEAPEELLAGYLLLGTVQLATQADLAPLYEPLAALQVLSIVVSLASAVLGALTLLAGRLRTARAWAEIAPLGGLSLAAAVALLFGLAALRGYAETMLGIHWIA